MQETEINPNVDHNLLSFLGFSIEVETSSENSRAAIYVSSKVDYIRRGDLEGTDSNLIIIDLKGSMKLRLINIYRSHSLQHGVSQRDKFNQQLSLIDNAVTNKTILLGDFNLDWFKRHSSNYALRNMFADFEEKLQAHNLIQVIDSRTWTRTVNNTVRESCLDHL